MAQSFDFDAAHARLSLYAQALLDKQPTGEDGSMVYAPDFVWSQEDEKAWASINKQMFDLCSCTESDEHKKRLMRDFCRWTADCLHRTTLPVHLHYALTSALIRISAGADPRSALRRFGQWRDDPAGRRTIDWRRDLRIACYVHRRRYLDHPRAKAKEAYSEVAQLLGSLSAPSQPYTCRTIQRIYSKHKSRVKEMNALLSLNSPAAEAVIPDESRAAYADFCNSTLKGIADESGG